MTSLVKEKYELSELQNYYKYVLVTLKRINKEIKKIHRNTEENNK